MNAGIGMYASFDHTNDLIIDAKIAINHQL
jgi:hypothetical protein